MFGQNHRSSDNMAITRRREEEDKRRTIVNIVNNNARVGQMANWEKKTDSVIRRNTIRNMARTLEKRDKAALKERQQRLAELLASDDQVRSFSLLFLSYTIRAILVSHGARSSYQHCVHS